MVRLADERPKDGQRVRFRLYGDPLVRTGHYYTTAAGYLPDGAWDDRHYPDDDPFGAFEEDEWEPLEEADG